MVRPMDELAPGLYLLRGFPRNLFNVYLMGGVLVDAATRYGGWRILRQLPGHHVVAHTLTHAHPDHQGASKYICRTLGVPLWCGAADAGPMESGDMTTRLSLPPGRINRLPDLLFAGPGHPVDRALREGDEVGGFIVIETPGHTAGHVAYWREADRTLVLGDVLFNIRFPGRPGLREPPADFTPDPARNRDSARKLAALRPALICFGHGPPLRDGGKFVEFTAGLEG